MNEKTETPEPLAAILAEMRGRILGEDRIKYTLPADEALAFVDRIEAAAERMRDAYCELCKDKDAAYDRLLLERDKAIKARNPGNAAAMRAALERIVGWCEGCHSDACEKVCRPELTSESIHAARAALATPIRNCDRFQSFDEALAEFNKTHESLKFCYSELHKWLFAPAEKGGAK